MIRTHTGKITQIIGSVVDVKFNDHLPDQNELVLCRDEDRMVHLEVKAHRANGVVRCISLESTDGLRRGMQVVTTGSPLKVPVGAKRYFAISYVSWKTPLSVNTL